MNQPKQEGPINLSLAEKGPADIEDRLKVMARDPRDYSNHDLRKAMNEAADEIARLRMAVAMLENDIKKIEMIALEFVMGTETKRST